jgi:hypothetical protein
LRYKCAFKWYVAQLSHTFTWDALANYLGFYM